MTPRLNPLSRAAGAVLALAALCGTGSSLAAQAVDSPASLGLDSLLSTPVSTGAKYDQTTREVGGSVTIVSSEDIRRFGYRTLEEALQSMAGVYTSYDRNYAQVGVRGFSRPSDFNNRILVLIDGHTTNESMWGSAMVGEEMALDLRAVDRIEVVRGPASALYGTGAMFGVINIITRSGAAQQGARVDLGGGSFGRQTASAGGGFALGARGGIAVSAMVENRDGRDLFFPEFDSPATNNGIAHNLDYQRRAGGLLSAQRGDLSLRAKYTYRVKGTPTASYGQNFNDRLAQVRDAAGYVELKYDHDLSAVHHFTARTYYDDYYYGGDYPYGGDLTGDRAASQVVGGEAALRWDPLPNNRVTAGAEYRWNARTTFDILDLGVLSSSIDQTFSVVSLYLQDDFQIRSNLSLLLGARHDESSLAGGATTPRVALIYDPRPGTTLKAMYGRAYRAPSLSESASAEPGRKLGPERLTMAELIWIERLGTNVLLTSSLYRYAVDGLIDALGDTASVNIYRRNLGEVRSQGIEANLDVRPATRLRGYLNYSTGRALDDDTGSLLTNSPNHLLKVGLAAEVTSQTSAAAELRYESGRKTLAGTKTDPFLIANLNLGIHPFLARAPGNGSRFLHGFDVAFRITNLFNTRYAYPGGAQHVQNGIEQDGRALMVRVGYEF